MHADRSCPRSVVRCTSTHTGRPARSCSAGMPTVILLLGNDRVTAFLNSGYGLDCSYDFPPFSCAYSRTLQPAVEEQARLACGGLSLRVSGARWLTAGSVLILDAHRWSQSAVHCPASSLAAPIGADQGPSNMDSVEEAGTAANLTSSLCGCSL